MREPERTADEMLDELHELRLRLAARFDDDPAKLIAHLQEYHQHLLRAGWTEAAPRDVQEKPAA